jgi:hypothetical protein
MRTTHHRLQKIAPALAAAWIAITVLSPRLTIAQSGSKCTVFGTPQVSPALVKLDSVATLSTYKKGMPIHVTLTVRAKRVSICQTSLGPSNKRAVMDLRLRY